MDDPRLIMPDESPSSEQSFVELEGTVERITFRNDENGYTVARFNIEKQGLATITGKFVSITDGEFLRLKGTWNNHPRFGLQFVVSEYKISAPATIGGMEKYLASGLIPGIGPKYAERIIKHFGDKIFDIIENHPERLGEVTGIGRKRAKSLAEAFRKQQAIRRLMMFLQSHDVSPTLAVKIYKEYGEDAIGVLKENPFNLADDIFGVGFRTADTVARKLGMAKEDPKRYRAGIRYILQEATNDGHVFLPRNELLIRGEELLEADVNSLDEAIAHLAQTGDTIIDGDNVYLQFLYKAENEVARLLANFSSGKVKSYSAEKFELLVCKIQKTEKLDLAEEQVEAVRSAWENQAMVITGGPGTGKSTTVRVIVRLFEHLGKNVRLASPTGRAAKRLEEACGRPASTIHRLLEYNPKSGFGRNADVPLDCKVLIVDEVSMLDIPLAYYLLRSLEKGSRLILVGDVDQLPSVGPGCVLRDIIDSGVIRTVRLTQIFRQAAGSLIVTNAHRINSGQGPTFDPSDGEKDFRWMKIEDKETIGDHVIEIIRDKLSKDFDPRTEIQVLTPMHAGNAGARELNRRLQETCNPPSASKDELKIGERTFRTGDRVMQIRNNYELDVFNGDIGTILGIDKNLGGVTVRYDRAVRYGKSDLDELQLAYAITVHKSQGSEYPCVVIPLTTAHWIMLQRNLIYTAITRAKKYCVLVGQRGALWRSVKNARTGIRNTDLARRIRSFSEGTG